HWLRNVFKILLTQVTDVEGELAFDLLVSIVGKADLAGASQRLHASRNVDAIAINIALVDDDVTDVDADTEFDPAIFGDGSVTRGHGTLDFDGATNGINRAWKFNQGPVTCSFDDTTAILSNLGIDQFAAASLERRESSFLVSSHQAAVTGNIGREDGSQPSFDPRLGHKGHPAPLYFRVKLMVEGGMCLSKQRCPVWVISGNTQRKRPCPLYPQ